MTQLETILERIGGEKRIQLGLERFQEALKAIGNPQASPHSIVIGGTNGKGSTTLYVSAALKEAGFRVTTYLSPHLQCPTERFLVDLKPIDYASLEKLAIQYEPLAEKHELTYFEFLTLLYFVWVKEQKADFSVMEVGLGGRLDATNVGNPIATAVTNISFDHQKFLGATREAILEEKMGILRPEGLMFSGVKQADLRERVIDACNAVDAIYYFSEDLRSEVVARDIHGQKLTINGYPFEVQNPSPRNIENVKLAFLLLRIVFPKIPIATLQSAFKRVKNPARMELMQTHPKVYLSGDHNPDGIECLLESIKELEIKNPKIVCAFSPDKPFEAMFKSLQSVSSDITLTSVSRLKDSLPASYFELGHYVEAAKTAVKQALSTLTDSDTLIITGSLYLAGEVRSLWNKDVTFQC